MQPNSTRLTLEAAQIILNTLPEKIQLETLILQATKPPYNAAIARED
jgi:hypothetical protein